MSISDTLKNVTRLFLDTAPVIYFVEQHPGYTDRVNFVFDAIDQREILGVTSSVTLAESLIQPIRLKAEQLQADFTELITQGRNTIFLPVGQSESVAAAKLRAQYNLSLTDAFQVAVAIGAGCEAFLTNDRGLSRINEMDIIVLDDVTV